MDDLILKSASLFLDYVNRDARSLREKVRFPGPRRKGRKEVERGFFGLAWGNRVGQHVRPGATRTAGGLCCQRSSDIGYLISLGQ